MVMDESTMANISAPDLNSSFEGCLIENRTDPCIIVIIGASGDLTSRKLVPALFNLFVNNGLPDPCVIMGCARTRMHRDQFIQKMKQAVEKRKKLDEDTWNRFSRCLFYESVNYDDPISFKKLAKSMKELDIEIGTKGNRIFYLATPPILYEQIVQALGSSGLSEEASSRGWSRIVVEKPFGHDLDSAIDLDQTLHKYFYEHQIFRIDHYLAKETVQNILMFRFANSIFEPLWNRLYIEYVSITASEKLGVEHRAGYYEQAGVLRDMFQNHMMQLLALTTMEPPAEFEADRVRDEKVKVYRALRPFPVEDLGSYLVLGQYAKGKVDGVEVPGYREEIGVAPDSLTPTFASMKIFVDNWRWQGVPFYLTSGKRLAEKLTEISIQFKGVPHCLFRHVLEDNIPANKLVLSIYPDERITMTFQTKNPGARLCLRSVTMDFSYHQDYKGPVLEAYEKVLLDCMLGDQMLFWRQDGVELCWSFLTPILRECESCKDRADMLQFYEAGSRGPIMAMPQANMAK